MGSEDLDTPESMELGLITPVMSLEYNDFYIIPYFSNYLISKCGVLLKKVTANIFRHLKIFTDITHTE